MNNLYRYIKKVYNHDSTPLKLDNIYTIKKDSRFKDNYILTNYGLILSSYALKQCFERVGAKNEE